MTKKILLSIGILFLVWQSYKLLWEIDEVEIHSWVLLIFVAWVINMFITGIFAFSVFAFPAEKLLPKAYYKIQQPGTLKQFYQTLKVNLFRQILLATLWKSQKQRQKYFNGKKTGIFDLVEQSMKSEFGHILPFIILTLVSIYLLIIGQVSLGIVTFLINVIGNLYPVILQRHHRMRIQIIEARQQSSRRSK